MCFQDWELLSNKLKKIDCSCVTLVPGVENVVNLDILVALFMNFLSWKGSGELATDTSQNRYCSIFFFRVLC